MVVDWYLVFFTIVYTEGIFGWVSIDNPDQPSLNASLTPKSTVNLCLIDGCESIDTGRLLTDCWSGVMIDTPLTPWLTFHWHLGRRSTYTWLMHMSQLTHSQLFTNCWGSVDWVSTEYWSGCWSGTGQDVDQGYQWTADSFTTHDWFFYFIFPCFFSVLDSNKIY